MIVFHGPPPLEPGLGVELALRPDPTRPGAWLVDDGAAYQVGSVTPYVRTVTHESGVPLRWAHSCATVHWATEGTSEVAGTTEQDVIQQALATWTGAVASCSYLDLVPGGAIDSEVDKRDMVNLIKFRDTEWCRPAVGGDPRRCFSPSSAAITTVVFVDDPSHPRDGEIIDADIELNGVDFAIAVGGQTLGTAGCQAELANTLIHELGHLVGLDHTCRVPEDPPAVDDTGAPVPLCSQTTDPVITEATMYPFQDCGETKKESLEPDDLNAVCTIYPAAADPGTCAPPDDLAAGCCQTGRAAPPVAPLALVLFGLLRRRRSRRARAA